MSEGFALRSKHQQKWTEIMNAQAKEIKAATEQAIVKTMKLSDLYLSDLNTRQTTTKKIHN